MKKTSYVFSIDDFKRLSLKNGNGIYVIYKDHLSCDAWVMFVVNDGKIIDETNPSCWVALNWYGNREPYGASIELDNLRNKYPHLVLYIANLSYHTFCGKWTEEDVETEKKYKNLDFKVFDVVSLSKEIV